MYLYALIKPYKYSLNDEITYTIDDLKKMTNYDREHLSECKDMLELILRANYYDCDVCEFAGVEYEELDIYDKFVEDLVHHIRYRVFKTHAYGMGNAIEATGRYADFSKFMANPNLAYHQCVAINKNDGKHCLVMHDSNVIQVLGVISEWQAHYIVISDMIKNMESYAKDFNRICDVYGRCCSWLYDYGCLHYCGTSQCYCLCGSDPYCYDDNAPELDLSHNKKVVEEKMIAEEQIAEKVVEEKMIAEKADIENYKQLLAEKCDPTMFETTSNVATIKKSKGGYIAVELDLTCELVLHVDFDEYTIKKLDNEFPCDENLSDYVVDDVECVLINGGDKCFAHVGFKYNDVLYKIQSWEHKTMLSCSARLQKTKKISEELIGTVDKIRRDIANLPEIEHCSDAIIDKGSYLTKISHGPNLLYVNLNNKHGNSVKFQELIGKCDGKTYQFVKIGKQTYKIKELDEYQAGCTIMRQRIDRYI